MKQMIAVAAFCSGVFASRPVAAQVGTSGTQYEWFRWSDGVFQKAGPITGAVHRTAIPNEYLELVVTRGTLHIHGWASDTVAWSLIARDRSTYIRSDSVPPRYLAAPGNPALAKSLIVADRYALDMRIDPASKPSVFADIEFQVPRDLRYLHVTMHGAGDVAVDNFGGELTVTADSGTIIGTTLSGPTILESRGGGVELDFSQQLGQRGPVSLLSHNGSISLLLPTQPSADLSLDATCGRINSDYELPFPKHFKLQFGVEQRPASSDVNCDSRPKSLPLLEGVHQLHNRVESTLGEGAVSIRAVALMGDINLKRAPTPTAGECVRIPDLGRNADGSPVIATIVGRVLDADGSTPLSGARVQIVGTAFSATSDKNGQYRIEFDPHSLDKCHKVYLQVVAPGHMSVVALMAVTKMIRSDDVVLHRTKPEDEFQLPDTPWGRAAVARFQDFRRRIRAAIPEFLDGVHPTTR